MQGLCRRAEIVPSVDSLCVLHNVTTGSCSCWVGETGNKLLGDGCGGAPAGGAERHAAPHGSHKAGLLQYQGRQNRSAAHHGQTEGAQQPWTQKMAYGSAMQAGVFQDRNSHRPAKQRAAPNLHFALVEFEQGSLFNQGHRSRLLLFACSALCVKTVYCSFGRPRAFSTVS